MDKNEMIRMRIPGTELFRIYNSHDIDPIAVWLGHFKYPNLGEMQNQHYIEKFRAEACEVYELAHHLPEWIARAKESPFYKYTEAYQRDCEYEERMKWVNENIAYVEEDDFTPDTEQVVTVEQAVDWIRSLPQAEEDEDEEPD